jgi:hypothetical protein
MFMVSFEPQMCFVFRDMDAIIPETETDFRLLWNACNYLPLYMA